MNGETEYMTLEEGNALEATSTVVMDFTHVDSKGNPKVIKDRTNASVKFHPKVLLALNTNPSEAISFSFTNLKTSLHKAWMHNVNHSKDYNYTIKLLEEYKNLPELTSGNQLKSECANVYAEKWLHLADKAEDIPPQDLINLKPTPEQLDLLPANIKDKITRILKQLTQLNLGGSQNASLSKNHATTFSMPGDQKTSRAITDHKKTTSEVEYPPSSPTCF